MNAFLCWKCNQWHSNNRTSHSRKSSTDSLLLQSIDCFSSYFDLIWIRALLDKWPYTNINFNYHINLIYHTWLNWFYITLYSGAVIVSFDRFHLNLIFNFDRGTFHFVNNNLLQKVVVTQWFVAFPVAVRTGEEMELDEWIPLAPPLLSSSLSAPPVCIE